jgi:hypothetical protein
MAADGLSEADIEAVQRRLTMLRNSDMVPTKYHVLRNDRKRGGRADCHEHGPRNFISV